MENKEDLSNQVAHIYDIIAEKYTELFWEDHTDDSETDRFLNLLHPKRRLLDAGCGPGNITRYLIAKGFPVVGVDISIELLRIAKKKVPEGIYSVMDIRKLSFRDASFNGIYSAYSFMHIPNKDVLPTLKEFYRVLEPMGSLFLATKAGSGEIFLEEPLADNKLCFFNFYDPDWLSDKIKKSGFVIKEFVIKKPITEGELPNEKLIYICSRCD